ncbi:YjbE family putative metal transport protein [Hydrocarboniphaga effusa]|uniref:YjbE family putative metal transport protein n=1 Tax=Hydrocarboniphaga effusa TaxID=243629 RepID=UPI00398C0C04
MELMTLPPEWIAAAGALVQVLLIDIVLAGDNAIAVGLAAAGLEARYRRRAILIGLVAAVIARIVFALMTVQLLQIKGLLLVGGLLLLWVCWKMGGDLRTVNALTNELQAASSPVPKTPLQAVLQILVADISMSLDNVLAVAGAASQHPAMMAFGLLLSIVLMGLAANAIAILLNRYRWIGYLGLAAVLFVALRMIIAGAGELIGFSFPMQG